MEMNRSSHRPTFSKSPRAGGRESVLFICKTDTHSPQAPDNDDDDDDDNDDDDDDDDNDE